MGLWGCGTKYGLASLKSNSNFIERKKKKCCHFSSEKNSEIYRKNNNIAFQKKKRIKYTLGQMLSRALFHIEIGK